MNWQFSFNQKPQSQGVWRAFVNEALVHGGGYSELWAMFEFLVFLAVPDMAAIVRWRTQQERALPARRRMEGVELLRFIAHYERLTAWMLQSAPAKADLTVELGTDHSVREIGFKSS